MNSTGLILSGGGARAAYQVGVLAAIARMRREAGASQGNLFPVISGTSAGAINAAFLACNADNFDGAIEELVEVWRDFQVEQVYRSDVLGMIRSGARWLSLLSLGWLITQKRFRPKSLLDNTPLSTLLQDRLALTRLPALLEQGHLQALAITASSYSTGEHVTFYESCHAVTPWVRNQRLSQHGRLTHEHLLASSAIPFIFPSTPLWVDGGMEFFGDGSMRQLSPLSSAVHLGADRILAIGVGQPQRTGLGTPFPTHGRPSLGAIAGHAMASVFHDTLDADVAQINRVNQSLSRLPDPVRAELPFRSVQVLALQPSASLDALAQEHAHALPKPIIRVLEGLGALRGSGAALASYLLFEPGFIQALMALGQADVHTRADEILAFLSPQPSQPVR